MLKIVDGIPFLGEATEMFRVRAVDLGNGHVEASASRVIAWKEASWSAEYLQDVLDVIAQAKADADPLEVEARNRERAARRAKTRVRRLCKAMGADTLLTLTYRACEADLSRAKADLKEFNRRMLRVLPGFAFVACFELQKRGAWHMHLATQNLPLTLPGQAGEWRSFNVIRSVWRSVTKDRGGNIDVQRRKFNSQRSAAQCAAYIAKYIAKGYRDQGMREGQNRYAAYGRTDVPESQDLGVVDSLVEAIEVTYALLSKAQAVATASLDRWKDWFFVAGEIRRKPRSLASPSAA